MPLPHQKILILELWGIGDLTFSTVLIRQALKAGDEVHLLGKPHAKALLEPSFPSIKFIPFEAGWTKFIRKYHVWRWNLRAFFLLILQLRQEHYDAVVSARNDPRDHFLMALIGGKRRFGFSRWGSRVFLTDVVKHRHDTIQHRVQSWRDLGLAMGYSGISDAMPKLAYPSYHSSHIDAVLKGINLPILVIHTGARIAVRRWPVPYFDDLIRRLRQTFRFYLVLIPDLDGYGSALAPLADLTLQHLTLADLTDVIGRADLVLCNDTGPGHLAASCGHPTISLFGPTEPACFKPWGTFHRVVRREICPHRPCFDYCRFPEPYCMTRLTPATVWPEIEGHIRLLAKNRAIPASFVACDQTASPFVAVIVATYRRPKELARLLDSLQAISIPMAVVVTDNAGDAETAAAMEAARGKLEVVRLTPNRNLGCGGGLALAEKEALKRFGDKLTHFWIMDDDALAAPDALEALLKALDNEKAFAACPMVLDAKGEIGWFPGLLERPVFDAIRKGRVRTPGEYRQRFGEKAVRFSWATGVSLLVERGALEAVGVHREDFLVRGEDLDFSLRLTAWGAGIFVPEARVQHLPPPVTDSPETLQAERRKSAIMVQNVAYIALYLPHGRRILRTLPGNIWRFIRAWGFASAKEALRACWKGAVVGVPAGASASQRKKLLVFAHTPPPHHGQSFMVQMMLDGLGGDRRAKGKTQTDAIQCYHVNCQFSQDMEDIGVMRLGKALYLLRYCLEAVWCHFRYGVHNFYYVPAPGKKSPLYRDWMVMLLCRPFFKRIIFHWHASGISNWLETRGNRLECAVTRLLLGRPQLSIALAEASSLDARWLQSRRIAIVPNGIPDPCPEFDQNLLPTRSARAKERAQRIQKENPDCETPIIIQSLYLAHCVRDKGLFDSLEGVAQFNKAHCAMRVHLTVAGAFMHADEEREFQNRIAQPDLAGAVTYAGFASGEAKKKLLEETDILCFPTYYSAESFPLTIVEALAYGIPVIATQWRAIPEILPPHYPGFVEPRSPQQIASAFWNMAGLDISTQLRRRYLALFSKKSHLEQLANAITGIETKHNQTA